MSKLDCGGNWIACPSYIGNTAGSAPLPACAYVAENGTTVYVAEDGTTIYEPEICGPIIPGFSPNFNMLLSSTQYSFGAWRIM